MLTETLINTSPAESTTHHRWSQAKKESNDKQWYKDRMNEILSRAFTHVNGYGGINDLKRKKVNYDLFNNIIDKADFEYVCKPYGSDVGELPASFTNRDIISPKIKVILGMEIKRPFGWKVVAVNEEATTRREQEEFKRHLDFVVSQIMSPIKIQAEQKYQEQLSNKAITEEQRSQIEQQIQQEIQTQTPDEVRRYMSREHQDPAEVLMQQLLTYLIQSLKVYDKFNKGWKHAQLAGEEFYRVYIKNDEPAHDVVNPLYFDFDRSPDLDMVEDGEWAVYKHMMTHSQVIAAFPNLKPHEIDKIYEVYPYGMADPYLNGNMDINDWSFSGTANIDGSAIPIYHVEFKSLCKIGFLKYTDENGVEQETIVSETYKLNEAIGDIEIDWQYIPQRHEGYKVADIYLDMRPCIGQHTDLEKLWECKLSYKGCAYDNLNSSTVSSMDRGKPFQYFYDIINYRVEMLIASDKGKKILMNIDAIPKDMDIDITKWLYYLDATGIGWYSNKQEGARGNENNAGTIAKDLDMSMASQINNYIQLLDYIETRCGAAIGVPKSMEGQIAPNDAVTNTKQAIVQSSHILEPMFELHNIVKGNVLTALVDIAKVAYTIKKPKKLAYVLDDLSINLLDIDTDLLDSSSYGLFILNASKANEVKQLIEQLAHAAVQNQAIDLSDVIRIVKADGNQEAEEMMKASEQEKSQRTTQQQLSIEKSKNDEAEKARAFEREKWAYERETKILVQKEKGDDDLEKQAILSIGFATNKDENNNGQPDVLEVADHLLNSKTEQEHILLEKAKLAHKQKDDAEKNKLAEKKIEVDRIKANKPSGGSK